MGFEMILCIEEWKAGGFVPGYFSVTKKTGMIPLNLNPV